MATTYTPIATTTLGSNTADVTFSSISSAYTDLILVIKGGLSSSLQLYKMQLNSDTGTNYSYRGLSGDGSSATSFGYANQNFIPLSWSSPSTSVQDVVICQLNNYSNTTTYKTTLTRYSNASTGTDALVSLWRSTSAISTIKVFGSSGNLLAGSTFTLYGVKSA